VRRAARTRTQINRRGRRERREAQKRRSRRWDCVPSASSALSAVRFALSRALRRPGAMRGPCGKSKNADQPQRPRRAQSGTGEPCPHCCPPLRPQRSLRSDSPYHVRCGDPERCVGPAARARTQINRRGRRERRGEQKRDVLIAAPLCVLSALPGSTRELENDGCRG
jgi:hypothetical protein